jgi:hypothetical protein
MKMVLIWSIDIDIFQKHSTNDGFNILEMCAKQGWRDLFQKLETEFHMEGQAGSMTGRTKLHWAIEERWTWNEEDYSTKTPTFLNKQDRDGMTALHLAAEFHHVEACQSLLRLGANSLLKNKRGMVPIHIAAENGHRDIVIPLLRQAREFGRDKQGRELLHFFAMWQSQDFVTNYIWDHRPCVEVPDNLRRRPLHYAAIHCNRFITR